MFSVDFRLCFWRNSEEFLFSFFVHSNYPLAFLSPGAAAVVMVEVEGVGATVVQITLLLLVVLVVVVVVVVSSNPPCQWITFFPNPKSSPSSFGHVPIVSNIFFLKVKFKKIEIMT